MNQHQPNPNRANHPLATKQAESGPETAWLDLLASDPVPADGDAFTAGVLDAWDHQRQQRLRWRSRARWLTAASVPLAAAAAVAFALVAPGSLPWQTAQSADPTPPGPVAQNPAQSPAQSPVEADPQTATAALSALVADANDQITDRPHRMLEQLANEGTGLLNLDWLKMSEPQDVSLPDPEDLLAPGNRRSDHPPQPAT